MNTACTCLLGSAARGYYYADTRLSRAVACIMPISFSFYANHWLLNPDSWRASPLAYMYMANGFPELRKVNSNTVKELYL
jgi:hypothetical protein